MSSDEHLEESLQIQMTPKFPGHPKPKTSRMD